MRQARGRRGNNGAREGEGSSEERPAAGQGSDGGLTAATRYCGATVEEGWWLKQGVCGSCSREVAKRRRVGVFCFSREIEREESGGELWV